MELKPGEIVCEKCKGTGYDLRVPKEQYNPGYYNKHYKCKICKGTGKLDWIEVVVGKKPTYMKPGVYTREVDFSEKIKS